MDSLSPEAMTAALERLRQWTAPFDAFCRDSVLDADAQLAVNMLHLAHASALLAIHAAEFHTGEMIWDEYEDHYAYVVELAEAIVKSDQGSSGPDGLRRTISLDSGIIAPLFIAIWRCRVSRIRKRGIELLKSCPRQEGIWDSRLTGRVCERMVALEEEGFGEIERAADLPEWARIVRVAVKFDFGERHAVMSYSKPTSREDPTIVKIPRDHLLVRRRPWSFDS